MPAVSSSASLPIAPDYTGHEWLKARLPTGLVPWLEGAGDSWYQAASSYTTELSQALHHLSNPEHWRWPERLVLFFTDLHADAEAFSASLVASGVFAQLQPAEIGQQFDAHLHNPWVLIGWGTLVLVLTLGIVGRGVRSGLEKAANLLMPLLFLFLVILVGFAASSGHFAQAAAFMFSPDFSKLSASGILLALGHAFFTLSIGGGAMMVYGSYLPKSVSIVRTSILIAILDTAAALLAGMAIFPIVFAHGLEPAGGPGLIFVTLPIAFGQMPFGTLFGTLFFVMLSVAALTSAFSLIEPAIAWLTEKRGMSRLKACLLGGGGIWLLSLGTVFSFNIGADWTLAGKTFFEALDYLTSGWMLPLGALCMALFTAWVMKPEHTAEELGARKGVLRIWLRLMRYLVPVIILVIFLQAVGVIAL